MADPVEDETLLISCCKQALENLTQTKRFSRKYNFVSKFFCVYKTVFVSPMPISV